MSGSPNRSFSLIFQSLGVSMQFQTSVLHPHIELSPFNTALSEMIRRRSTVPLLLFALLSSLLLISIWDHSAKAEVISLTSDIFDDKIQEKDTAWFVKFCVPWCKHCKNLGTLWEDLGKEMEGEDEIEVGEVDCATNKPVCNKVDIHSYPTFKVFYNGEEVAKYQGAKDTDSLKVFVLEETEKAAIKAQQENNGEL